MMILSKRNINDNTTAKNRSCLPKPIFNINRHIRIGIMQLKLCVVQDATIRLTDNVIFDEAAKQGIMQVYYILFDRYYK